MITAATPIITPSRVRMERSLFAHKDCSAILTASPKFMADGQCYEFRPLSVPPATKAEAPPIRKERQGRVCKLACKPNSVEDDHSSRRHIAVPLKRPTRRFPTVLASQDRNPGLRAGPARIRGPGLAVGFPPYLVLLRVGFTLPPPLQAARCALTAPFHPYPRW